MDRCWAFTLAYNEAVLIPYWVAHYRAFCERVTVYVDDATDDGTDVLAARAGAEVRYARTDGLDDEGFVRFAHERYPAARGLARWVVWVDADEFLHHPAGVGARLDYLRAHDVTRPVVQGYQMVAEAPPKGKRPITEQITRGMPAREYSKQCVFDPELGVHWGPGKHHASVTGGPDVRDDGTDPLRLLHYRYLGTAWMEARNARNFSRMGEAQRARRHGAEVYPGYEGVYSPAWFAEQVANATEVVGA
jgi:glycosyltransferase involved in cell wall biosynthesis